MAVVRNINTVRKNLKNLQGEIKQEVIKAIEDVTLDLTDKAKNLAPLDTGALRASGKGEVKQTGQKVRGEVTFDKPYALKQHEEMSYNHPRGGQAKYLELPLRQNQDRYKKYIEDKIKKKLR